VLPVSYEDRKSTWNSGVRKAIRQGSAEEEVRKHRDRVTGAWKQISKQRRHEHAVATRRVSKNLQQGRAGGEGTGYRGDNTCQKKSRDTVQPRSRVFLRKSFLGQATGWGRNQ